MNNLSVGVIGTSGKENERRVPIHSDHLLRITKELRSQLIFETGYGERFGIADSELAQLIGGLSSRDELLENMDAVIIPKPVLADFEQLREGGVMWGYPHCTQQRQITQIAINRKQTIIAFEDMLVWGPEGQVRRHTFYKNNEMAGYCAVIHALQLKGIDGHYGDQRKVVILSFGAVSRGAIYALKAHGFRDITICIQRPDHEVREEVLDCHYVRLMMGSANEARVLVVEHDGTQRALTELISEAGILINGTFQDANNPIDFVLEEEKSCLKPGCLIIDVSCDERMGFYFAKPTSFKEPMFQVEKVDYYAVDHTPSYFWESASRSISAAMIVHLPTIIAGPDDWQKNETIRRAVNIDKGMIQKEDILAFQNRHLHYPHAAI